MTFKEKVNEMKIHHEEHKEERHERHEEKKFAHEIKHQMKEEERLLFTGKAERFFLPMSRKCRKKL